MIRWRAELESGATATESARTNALREASAVAIGMSTFALFAHRGGWQGGIGALGLLGAAVTLSRSLQRAPDVRALLGAHLIASRVPGASIVAVVAGCLGGWFYAQGAHITVAPTGDQIRAFLILAVAIGVAEELVYRGWLHGRLADHTGPLVAIVFSALAHTAYKTALFALPPSAVEYGLNLPGIAAGTFAGGLILGGLRVASRSVAPAVLAHAAFDAVGYASYQSAPWWLW